MYNFHDTPVVAPNFRSCDGTDMGLAKLYITEIFDNAHQEHWYPQREMPNVLLYTNAIQTMVKRMDGDFMAKSRGMVANYYLDNFVSMTIDMFYSINDSLTLRNMFEDDQYISYLFGLINFSKHEIDEYLAEKITLAYKQDEKDVGSIYFKTMDIVVNDIIDALYIMCISPSTSGFVLLRKKVLALMRIQLKACRQIILGFYTFLYKMHKNIYKPQLPVPSHPDMEYVPFTSTPRKNLSDVIPLKTEASSSIEIRWNIIDQKIFLEMMSQSLFYYVKTGSDCVLKNKPIPSNVINALPKPFNTETTSEDVVKMWSNEEDIKMVVKRREEIEELEETLNDCTSFFA